MIKIINPSRMTASSFFKKLVAYLESDSDVILREIKREFSDFPNLDRQLDDFIRAGYILRQNKRYYLNLPFLENLENLNLGQEVFIREESLLFNELNQEVFETELTNETNGVLIRETTHFQQEELTLANYFYRLKKGYPMSKEQLPLYEILGDVNPEYALKYMTSFLLKYVRKDELVQKRVDIFVEALLILGYVRKNEEGKYLLNMEFDKERLIFKAL